MPGRSTNSYETGLPWMARFFFNQYDGEFKPDDKGLEFPTLDQARVEAVRYAGEVLRDHPTLVWKGEDFRIEVTQLKATGSVHCPCRGYRRASGRNFAEPSFAASGLAIGRRSPSPNGGRMGRDRTCG